MNAKVTIKHAVLTTVLVAAGVVGVAQAATTNTTFQVKAAVVANCTVTATDIDFGNYDPIVANAATPAGDKAATGTVNVRCSKKATYSVGLNSGLNVSGTQRRMKEGGAGTDFLNYNLFRDAAKTLAWGNTVGTDTLAGTGTGVIQALTVYGTLPGGQNSNMGAYTDTVTVTVTY